jgi:hypothetical protein
MDFSPAALFVSSLTGSVGLGLFLYGKRQARAPQLTAGLLLMSVPFVIPGALWLALASGLLCLATWIAVRAGL